MNKIPPNIKIILGSVMPLMAVLILFVFAGQFGFGKISEIRAKTGAAQGTVNTLSSKLTVLESVNQSETQTNVALSALPSRNSSIVVVSQLKILAASQGVSLTNIKGGAEVKETGGLSRVDISFDALGPRPQILALATSIGQIAPITILDKIKLNESGGGVRANIAVKSYWSELPKSLPQLTDSVSELTPSEKTLLQEIAKLKQPLFIDLPASNTSGKTEPFNQ